MEKILGTIITIILIFYILKFVFKLIMPFLLKYLINKKMGGMFDQFSSFHNNTTNHYDDFKQDEDVIVSKPNSKKIESNISDDLGGEYVDFEEIKK